MGSMGSINQSIPDEMVAALRRINRTVDLHSRSLVQSHGLTGPQAALLKALIVGPLTAGELATRINLSQGTVTDILNRLEGRELVCRVRDEGDKRRVIVALTDKARTLVQDSFPLMQQHFSDKFGALPDWEQSQLLAALQRIAFMMEDGIAVPARSRQKAPVTGILVGPPPAEMPATE